MVVCWPLRPQSGAHRHRATAILGSFFPLSRPPLLFFISYYHQACRQHAAIGSLSPIMPRWGLNSTIPHRSSPLAGAVRPIPWHGVASIFSDSLSLVSCLLLLPSTLGAVFSRRKGWAGGHQNFFDIGSRCGETMLKPTSSAQAAVGLVLSHCTGFRSSRCTAFSW